MSENKTEAAPRPAKPKRKPKKSQLPVALLVFVLMVVVGILLRSRSSQVSMFWVFGGCFGFILQKARFCFTASMRDPVLTGTTTLTKAVLVAFAVSTIGFAAIKYSAFAGGQPIPGQSFVQPISFATVLGGVLFGIGMVIAGGCASGTLMRVGEGFAVNTLALVFFIIGSLWGAHDMGFWSVNFVANGKKVFLPDVFGWFGAVVFQLLLIFVLYIAADLWERKKLHITDDE
ncbi:YeeE/YedE thiosulfate transporter family protein [Marasmitruncus massiliensis]|jgi:hypothetical protein|uniref:YeeE/YedE thiosulfate transporter family protein n=1 Tax=Marasmitruncus massiliensis TaxID=1944642 RepID=UPI000C7D353E|nr:YeeE/YedE thiosulfate transporter family protein [Marasmitruncus massiliensis]MBE6907702.1 transporter [Oscillospiraceae bacterium]